VRKGAYWHLFPTYREAKDAVWRDPNMLFSVIPEEIIEKKNEAELVVYLKNGSYIQLIGANDPDKLRGAGPMGIVLDEYDVMKEDVWPIVQPIIRANGGWAWFIGTPKGKQKLYDLYNLGQSEDKEWKSWYLKASESGIISDKELENSKKTMSQSLFNQEFECFAPDTDIITSDGVKLIKDIVPGDLVFTHTNRYQKVLGVSVKDYNGVALKVFTYGNNKPVICTLEHPFRITDGKTNKWVKAQDIKVSNGNGHGNVADRVTFGKPVLGKKPVISLDFAKLLAWYVSEGSYSHNNLQLSIGSHEQDYIDEVIKLLQSQSDAFIRTSTSSGCTVVSVSDAELGTKLMTLCGSGAKNKRIPLLLIAGYERDFYETLIKGDGCRVNSVKDSYVTVSKTLAYQVQLLAHTLSYTASISEIKGGKGFINGRSVNLLDKYIVRINTKSARSGLKLKAHKYNVSASVSSVGEIQYDGLVYNLQVLEDNSYTANGRVVHNCEFLEGEGSVFRNVRQVSLAVPQAPKANHYYVMGVDLAKVTDYTVISVFDTTTNSQVYQDRFNTLEWPFQKKKIAEIAKHYNNALIQLDATGIGDPVADDLLRLGLNVNPIKITNELKKEMVEKLSIWIEQQKIRLINIEESLKEYDNYSYEIARNGRITYNARLGYHDDIVTSHFLAVWGLQTIVVDSQTQNMTITRRLYLDKIRGTKEEDPYDYEAI
jgi:hypothetical protein